MIPITCTSCGGASQIDEAWQGQWVQCPYCAKPTQAGAATPISPGVPPPPPVMPPAAPPEAAPSLPPLPAAPSVELIAKPKSEAKTQAEAKPTAGAKPPLGRELGAERQAAEPAEAPAPRAPLSREQRLAIRRRVHLALALGGGVLLAVAAYVLFVLSS